VVQKEGKCRSGRRLIGKRKNNPGDISPDKSDKRVFMNAMSIKTLFLSKDFFTADMTIIWGGEYPLSVFLPEDNLERHLVETACLPDTVGQKAPI